MKTDEKIVLISPVTTATGTDPFGSGGLIPEGKRLADLPVTKFSPVWMKAVTQVDQRLVAAELKRRAEAKEKAKPGDRVIAQLQAEAASLQEQVSNLREDLAVTKKDAFEMFKELESKIDAMSANSVASKKDDE